MKKLILLFAACAMALSLAACSHKDPVQEGPAPTPKPTAVPDWSDVLAASASNAAAAKTPPASATDVSADAAAAVQQAQAPAAMTAQEACAKAQACVGLPVEELYAAVGQPTQATYGPSCLQVNAEDGMLTYDGFSVWTVRSDTAETVHEVYPDE